METFKQPPCLPNLNCILFWEGAANMEQMPKNTEITQLPTHMMKATTALSEYRDLLSAADLSEIFAVSIGTIYKEMRNGKFGTPIKIGRAYKIPKIYIIERYFGNYSA
jgi:predicted DNA-binding transcriptional regulator AlpA